MQMEREGRRNPTRTIRVESGAVYVVPFPFARSYFGFEIEDEGFHRSDCHPVVLLPRHEAGQATREWVEAIFAAMDEVRRIHPREALETPGLSPLGGGVDVGLLDIPVTVRGPLELVTSNLKRRPMEIFEANLLHVDALLAGTFHDQMTLVSVLHVVRPDGTPEIHYHNLVFGVRREISRRKNHHRSARLKAYARQPHDTVSLSARGRHSRVSEPWDDEPRSMKCSVLPPPPVLWASPGGDRP